MIETVESAIAGSLLREQLVRAEENVVLLKNAISEIESTVPRVLVPKQGVWTKFGLTRWLSAVEHLEGVTALLDLTAVYTGHVITFEQVLLRSKLEHGTQKMQHAAMSRVSLRLFNEKKWPVEAWQSEEPDENGSQQMLYRMPQGIADWYREIKSTLA